jgi:hypothetical protein
MVVQRSVVESDTADEVETDGIADIPDEAPIKPDNAGIPIDLPRIGESEIEG